LLLFIFVLDEILKFEEEEEEKINDGLAAC
jgi:hypothetical protein